MTPRRYAAEAAPATGSRPTGPRLDAWSVGGVAATPPPEPERYLAQPARPLGQMAVRVGLWAAVALGCVGGIAGLLRSPAGGAQPELAPPVGSNAIPAPVARRAEQVVEVWLTATEADQERLEELFLEPPSLEGLAPGTLSVGEAAAVSGRQLQEGYWAVTVEVAVTDALGADTGSPDDGVDSEDADDPDGSTADGGLASVAPDGAGEGPERQTTTWFLDVPIVGRADGGLVALAPPALLAAPPEVSTGWRPSLSEPRSPDPDDPTARTVDGFLDALLAGGGDPERYVAPGLATAAANPPPFSDVEVRALAVDQLSEGEYRVFAEVVGSTPGGTRRAFAYELVVVERVDRLEITRFSGAPAMVAGSAEPPEAGS